MLASLVEDLCLPFFTQSSPFSQEVDYFDVGA